MEMLLKSNILPQATPIFTDDYATLHELHTECANPGVLVCSPYFLIFYFFLFLPISCLFWLPLYGFVCFIFFTFYTFVVCALFANFWFYTLQRPGTTIWPLFIKEWKKERRNVKCLANTCRENKEWKREKKTEGLQIFNNLTGSVKWKFEDRLIFFT